MDGPERARNQRLTDLIDEAGFSLAGLARRVNEAGAAEALNLGYGKGSVGHWKNGHNPPDAVRRIVLGLLAAKLGRRITAEDAGWPPSAETPNPLVHTQAYRGFADVPAVLPALWSADMLDRRGALTKTAAVLPFGPALMEYLTAEPDRDVSHRGGVRVGATDVRMIRDLTASLRELDHKYGGGRFRANVVGMLHDHATPLLRGTYSHKVGRALYSAVGELTTLAGWLAFDSNQNALAQRYYWGGLRLAQSADDPRLAGFVLTRMAHLAVRQGDGEEAVRLGAAAVRAAERTGQLSERMRTEYLLHQARGYGVLGNQPEVRRQIRAAEEAWAAGTSDDDPVWTSQVDFAELHGAASQACALAGMGSDGLAHAAIGISRRDPERHRRRLAMTLMNKANLALAVKDADLAIDAAIEAAKLSDQLSSARLPDRLGQFGRRLTTAVGPRRAAPFHDALRSSHR